MGGLLLIYKQHRFEVLTTIGLGLFVTVGAIVEGFRLNSVQLPAGCDASAAMYVSQGWAGPPFSPDCLAASGRWQDIKNGIDMHIIPTLPWILPFFFGILLGAPLVAREIESGTAPLSWALAGSRRRWLMRRVAAMALLLVPLLLAMGLASDYLDGAVNHGMNPWASFMDYMSRGLPLAFWGLAAFAGSVALGTLLGRTLPAVALAAIVCLLVRGTWDAGSNHIYLRPFSEMLVTQAEAQSGQFTGPDWGNDLVVDSQYWLDGKPWSGDPNVWWQEHFTQTLDANGNLTISSGPAQDANGRPVGPYPVPFGFPSDRYWPIVLGECLILMAGALFCATIAFLWIGRRRPY